MLSDLYGARFCVMEVAVVALFLHAAWASEPGAAQEVANTKTDTLRRDSLANLAKDLKMTPEVRYAYPQRQPYG